MNSAKTLIILSPGFPADEQDENCIPILQAFVKALCRLKPDLSIHVIAFHYPFHRQTYHWHGIPVYPLGGKNQKGLQRLKVWVRAWRKIRELKHSGQALILHSIWLNECYALSTLYATFHRAICVATVLGQDAKRENLYLRLIKNRKARVVCSSDFAARVLKEEQGMNCRAVIPIGIDVKEFADTEFGERHLDLLGVGNLGPVKRYDVFLRVVAEVKKHYPDIKAEIIGEGEMQGRLQELIKTLGLQQHVKLRGGLPRPLVLERMKSARVLLHTSSYEGQCYVYLEALASGASVVALNRGFLPKSEKVIAVEQDHELAAACVAMLDKPAHYSRCIPFPIEDTVQQYYMLYQD